MVSAARQSHDAIVPSITASAQLSLTAARFMCVEHCDAGGIGFWTFAFPQDLIKSIIQTHAPPPSLATAVVSSNAAKPTPSAPSPSFVATARELVAREGVGRLWRGFPVALFRGIPGAAITFTTYTTVMQNINQQGW